MKTFKKMKTLELNSQQDKVGFYVTLLISSWILGLSGESFYTPAMPSIATTLHASDVLVKYTISFFILGKAVSMFLCGPIAESFSRKQFTLLGLGLFIVGSTICVFSNKIQILLSGRLLEGLGCSICILMGRAIINDNFTSARAAHVFSYIFIGNALGIILLPIFGGYIANYLGWRGNFAALTLYGIIVFGLMWLLLPNSNKPLAKPNLATVVANYQAMISNSTFWGFVLALVFIMAGEKAYTTAAAFLFIKTAGFSEIAFGYLTATMWLAHLLGTFMCGQLALKFGIDAIMKIGSFFALFASILMLLLLKIEMAHLAIFSVMVFFYMLSTGFIITLAAVGIVRPFPQFVGMATALAMFLEFIIAFGISFTVSHYANSLIPTAKTIAVMGILAFTSWLFLIRPSVPMLSPETQ